MIGSTRTIRVFAFANATDMRKSWEGLSAIVRNEIIRDLLEGDMFLFVNRRRNREKVLFFDGIGLCIFMKRLERGLFAASWRCNNDKTLSLSMSELELFLDGSKTVGIISLVPPRLTRNSLEIASQI